MVFRIDAAQQASVQEVDTQFVQIRRDRVVAKKYVRHLKVDVGQMLKKTEDDFMKTAKKMKFFTMDAFLTIKRKLPLP